MCQPSEIVLLPFPFSDLSANKKRPVLILKSANFQGDFLAVQITSQAGHEHALVLQQDDFILGLLPKKAMFVLTSWLP
jgi:mRNA interferase MazF